MKKIIYLGLILLAIVCIIFIPNWSKKEQPAPVVNEEPKKVEESIEEKAYRVETTAVAAPEHYTSTETKIWDLEETFRVAQAKIRMAAGRDGEKFVKTWRAYKEENKELYKELHSNRQMRMLESRGKIIIAKFGDKSAQYKIFQQLVEKKKNGSLSLVDFYKELKKIK